MTSEQAEINGLRATLSAVLAAVVDPLIPINHEAPAAMNHPVHRANRAAKVIEELRKAEGSDVLHLPAASEARHLQNPWQDLIFTVDTKRDEARRFNLPLEEIMRRRKESASRYLGEQALGFCTVREEQDDLHHRCEFRFCAMTVDDARTLGRYIYALERQVDWKVFAHPWPETRFFRPSPPLSEKEKLDRYADSD